MFVFYNPNPANLLVGDCTVRAVSKLMDISWDDAYIALVSQGFVMKDRPDSNAVLGAYLFLHGFHKHIIPDTCPNCYSIKQFSIDNPVGSYLLATGTHVVAVIDGNYYDSWDSGNEVPVYYWEKEERMYRR